MMNYDYRKEMRNDIIEYMKDNVNLFDFESREEMEEKLNDDLWTEDSVTGNASGSYTFNSYKAREYVQDNMDDLLETIREFCIDAETVGEKFMNEEWEYFDVSIRCYLLGEVLSGILDDLEDDGIFDSEAEIDFSEELEKIA